MEKSLYVWPGLSFWQLTPVSNNSSSAKASSNSEFWPVGMTLPLPHPAAPQVWHQSGGICYQPATLRTKERFQKFSYTRQAHHSRTSLLVLISYDLVCLPNVATLLFRDAVWAHICIWTMRQANILIYRQMYQPKVASLSHPDQRNLLLLNGTIPLSPSSPKHELSYSHKLDQLLDMTEVLMYLFSVRPDSSSNSPLLTSGLLDLIQGKSQEHIDWEWKKRGNWQAIAPR